MNTFKQLPRYTLQQLDGRDYWQIAVDGKPLNNGSKSNALEYLDKWANGNFVELPRETYDDAQRIADGPGYY